MAQYGTIAVGLSTAPHDRESEKWDFDVFCVGSTP